MELKLGDSVYYTTEDNDSCTNCCAEKASKLCAYLHIESENYCEGIVWVKKEEQPVEMVNKPKHYQLEINGQQCEVRDILESLANRIASNGYSGMFVSDWVQAMQYLMRFDEKNGKEDVDKALYYVKKMAESLNVD